MNICMFSGRLTRDAQLVNTNSGHSIMKFGFAVTVGFGDKKKTEFLDCFKFIRENEVKVIPTLIKGKPLNIICEFQTSKWTDKEGNERTKPEFRIVEWEYALNDSTQKNKNGDDIPF